MKIQYMSRVLETSEKRLERPSVLKRYFPTRRFFFDGKKKRRTAGETFKQII